MRKIFTKEFSALTASGQTEAVRRALHDLRDDQFWLREESRERAKRSRQRLIKKAIQHGIEVPICE